MRPTLSIYENGEHLKEMQDAYDAGKKAFKAGIEHSQENMPEDFYSEWSDGWIDACQKNQSS